MILVGITASIWDSTRITWTCRAIYCWIAANREQSFQISTSSRTKFCRAAISTTLLLISIAWTINSIPLGWRGKKSCLLTQRKCLKVTPNSSSLWFKTYSNNTPINCFLKWTHRLARSSKNRRIPYSPNSARPITAIFSHRIFLQVYLFWLLEEVQIRSPQKLNSHLHQISQQLPAPSRLRQAFPRFPV